MYLTVIVKIIVNTFVSSVQLIDNKNGLILRRYCITQIYTDYTGFPLAASYCLIGYRPKMDLSSVVNRINLTGTRLIFVAKNSCT